MSGMKPPKHKIFSDTDVTVRPTCSMCTHKQKHSRQLGRMQISSQQMREVRQVDSEGKNTERNIEMSDSGDVEIKSEGTERLMTSSRDRQRRKNTESKMLFIV